MYFQSVVVRVLLHQAKALAFILRSIARWSQNKLIAESAQAYEAVMLSDEIELEGLEGK